MAARPAAPAQPLRGRDAEMAVIDAALGGARDGRGGVLLVEGGAGLGKSRLLEEAVSRAGRAGVRAAVGQADVDDNVVPMAPLMAACFGGNASLLDRNGLSALRVLRGDRYWVLLELEAQLERAALEHPMLICLDDLQWADAGTVEALRVLPARLGGVPIVWIAAYRTGQAPPVLLRCVAELTEANAARLVLDPLDEDSVGRVVADVMRAQAGAALLEIADNAHGVPFLLIELLRGLLEEGLVRIDRAQAVLVQARLPSRVGDSMRERLDRVPAAARRAAVAASALGRAFRFDDLATMLGSEPAALLEPVEELIRAEILAESGENLGFRHDIIRQAVLDSVPAAARRALDRQAAGVLLAAGAVPLEIATRLAASAEPGDEVAIATLHEAARALAPTDPGAASEFTRKALALTADTDPHRAALVAETAVLLHAAGRALEGREFASAALSRVLPPEAEAQVRLSIAQMYSLPADSRIESGRAALALPGVSAELRARHLGVMVLSLVAAARPGEARAAVADAEAAVRATSNASARLNLEFGRLALDEASFEYASMMPRIQAIRRLGAEVGEDVQVQAAEWFRSSLLAALDRLDEALEVARMGLAAAQRDHQAWIAPRWEIWRGWLLLQQGQLSDAGAALEGAFAAESIDLALAIPDAAGLAALGLVAIHTGGQRLSGNCAQIARATLAVGAFDDARRHLVWLLALQAMARGDAVAARDELRAGGGELTGAGLPVLAREVCTEPHLVRLALAAGDKALADAAVSDAEQRAGRNPDVASIAATASHARGLRYDDPDDLLAAVGRLDGGPRPLALASALEDLGRACATRARNEEGIAAFGRALELYMTAGATWDSRRVRGRLRALGVRRRFVSAERPASGWAALTDSELEVVRLVATGLTNRDTAERLFVSPHTIDTHLRHVFTKLDVNSRVELTRIALEREPGA
jgi:DNA-binding CsgD family transcriptional regulator